MDVSYTNFIIRAKETLVWLADNFQWITQLFIWTVPALFMYFLLCLNPKWSNTLRDLAVSIFVSLFELLSSRFAIFGGKSTQKLLFVPNADQQCRDRRWNYLKKGKKQKGFYEISQDALSRYLLSKETADLIDKLNSDGTSKTFDNKMYEMLSYLKDFQKECQIIEFEMYQSSMSWFFSLFGIYHTFIVLKTQSETEGEYWWSLEKNSEYIVMQRSRSKFAVVNRLKRKNRKNVKIISGKAIKGKGTMNDLLTTLWAHNVIPEKYHVVKSSCQTFVQFIDNANNQSFVNFVNKRITSFEPIVQHPAPPHHKLEPFINLLTKFPEWKPLFAIVYLGDPVLLENLLCNTRNYPEHTDVNLVAYDTSLLQLAILFSRTKMVEILLRNSKLNLTTPQNENSEMPWKDMSVFHTAAAFTNDPKILDLLLKHSKVKNDPDGQGRTALHIAAIESNEATVEHLLKIKLIDPNAPDGNGLSPLHLAAKHTDNTKIIDLILKAKRGNAIDRGVDECDLVDKRTALHHAVIGSNFTTARHLMKRGANPNQTDKDGRTPLELAAQQAKDMDIINLFLNDNKVYRKLDVEGGDQVFNCATKNENAGITNEIEYRLRSLGIIRKQQIPPYDDQPESSSNSTELLPNRINQDMTYNGWTNTSIASKLYESCSFL